MGNNDSAFDRLVAMQKDRQQASESARDDSHLVRDMGVGFIIGTLAQAFFNSRRNNTQ